MVEQILVIGGGLLGSAAAWQLSNNGKKVLLVEKQNSIYSSGSSLGKARIARSLGQEDKMWAYLNEQSIIETIKLIQFLNAYKSWGSHSISDIYSTSPVTYIFNNSDMEMVNQMTTGHSIPFELSLSSSEALNMFGVNAEESNLVLREYKTNSGTMNPQALIKKLHLGIKLKGGEILYEHQVSDLRKTIKGYKLKATNAKSNTSIYLECQKIVVAAGPYTSTLLVDIAPYFQNLIRLMRVPLSFFQFHPKLYAKWDISQKRKFHQFLPIIDLTNDIMYAMIEEKDSSGNPIIKIGGHFKGNEISNPDAAWSQPLNSEEINWGRKQLASYFKFLNFPVSPTQLEYIRGYSCIYSLTENNVPYVTNPIDQDGKSDPNMVVIGGMSGVGAKGALAYGLIGSNTLLQKHERSDKYTHTLNALGGNRLAKTLRDSRS